MTQTIAEMLAEFAAGLETNDVPEDVVNMARSCLLYGLGIAMCGRGERSAGVGARAAHSMDGDSNGSATLLFDGSKVSVPAAIMANSALFHARAQEDTSGTAHLGAVLIPVVLALIETRRASVEELLPAVIAGYEVGGQLEAALARSTLAAGFRASCLYGLLAATAAACRLLGLDADVTRNALAHAVAFDGGNAQSIAEGSHEWRFQLGMAGQAALCAVELARAGSLGARQAFEGKFGFAQVFAKRSLDASMLEGLGHDWILRRVMFKPYPVCAHNQSAVAGAITMRGRLAGKEADRIEVHVNPYMVPGMMLKGPFTSASETLLSTPFCVATALVRGRVEIADLEDFGSREVEATTAKVEIVADPDIPYPASEIIFHTTDGSAIRHAERVKPEDYTFDLDRTHAQLQRMTDELNLPGAALQGLHRFVMALPSADIGDVPRAFAAAATVAVR